LLNSFVVWKVLAIPLHATALRFQRGDFFIPEKHLAVVRLYRPGYQVKQRRFARAVWTNNAFKSFPAGQLC